MGFGIFPGAAEPWVTASGDGHLTGAVARHTLPAPAIGVGRNRGTMTIERARRTPRRGITATALLAAAVLTVGAPALASGSGWSYSGPTGPADWAGLSPEFAACDGTSQSPVDLVAGSAARVALPNPGLRLPTGEGEAVNNGHSVEVEAPAGGTITLGGTVYRFEQIHFHAPSEHAINGRHFPLEFHFVGKSPDGKVTVLAVMGEAGTRANAAYAPYAAAAEELTRTGQTEEVDLDYRALVPRASASLRYEGSLTTPPCTEGVRWTVLTTPVQLSADQVEAFNDVPLEQAPLGDNNRPLQPLNGRTVLLDVSRGFGANGG